MRILIVLFLFTTPCFAECPKDADKDTTYTEGSVTYGCPSKKTLNERSIKQAQEQAVVDAKKSADESIEKDKKDILEELIQERITAKKKK